MEYEKYKLLFMLLEGRTRIDLGNDKDLEAIKMNINLISGTPVVETLLNVWKVFGLRIGSKTLDCKKELNSAIRDVLTNDRGHLLKYLKTKFKKTESGIYYSNGFFYSDTPLTESDLNTACDLYLGVHKLNKECQIIKREGVIVLNERNTLKIIESIDFKISSIANVFRVINVPYISNSVPRNPEHLLSMNQYGNCKVIVEEGGNTVIKEIVTTSKYVDAVINKNFDNINSFQPELEEIFNYTNYF